MKINRVLKTTFRHIGRNGWFSFGSIAVIMLTFFITSTILVINYVANTALSDFEQKGQVIVFFQVGTDEEFINEFKSTIEDSGKVSSIEYVSEEEAMTRFLEWSKDDPTVSELLEEGILPASIHINAKKLEDLDAIINTIEVYAEEDSRIDKDIQHNKTTADALIQFNYWTRITGIVAFAFMALISLVIIVITISSNIKAHSEEIEIMYLVGGDSWYIRTPYILEGAFYGFIGSVVSTILLVLVVNLVSTTLQTYTNTEFVTNFGLIGSALSSGFSELSFENLGANLTVQFIVLKIIAGTVIGAFSSILAVLKYIK